MEIMKLLENEKESPKLSEENVNKCYLGLDLFKYEEGRRTFSIVLLCNGKVVAKYDDVGLEKVVRLSWEWNVSKIAIDSITELGEGKTEIGRFVSLLPEKTEIFQINLSDNQERDLREMLRSQGFSTGQLTPSKTAYYLALLASYGFGKEAVKKEVTTKIIVRKNRNLGPGGMSSNRYRRKVRTAILQIVNSIKDLLDSGGFDYDLLYRKSGGGLDGATFTVFASRESLESLIKPKTGTSVSIEIRPEYKIKLSFEESPMESKPLIVGIDPGMTYGIAILDIDGKIIYAGSWHKMSRLDAVEFIEKYGKPIVVATDVFPVPNSVKKIASQFGSEIFVPEKILSVEEKRTMVEEARKIGEIENVDAHTRDALAAAYAAYKALSRKLAEVNTYLQKTGLNLPADRIKRRIIEGASLADAVEAELRTYLSSVNKTIRLISYPETKRGEQKERKEIESMEVIRKENFLLRKKIEELENELERREKELSLYKKGVLQLSKEDYYAREIHRLRESIAEMEKALKKRESELESKLEEINRISSMLNRVINGEMVIVPTISSLTKANLGALKSIRKKIIYVENPDSYQRDAIIDLVKEDPLAVAIPGPLSDRGLISILESFGIPVLSLSDFESSRFNNIIFMSSEAEKEAIKRKEELRKAIRSEEKEKIISLIEKYKEERAKTSSLKK
ncbi:MAG: DUF460 domain-containing protein [Fervidicoccaceae archaeon]